MATDGEIAVHLDLSERSVRDLKKKGVFPTAARREMDQDACRIAYIRHLRNGAAGRDSSRPGSLEAERARLAKEQADLLERKNARERGDLVSLSEVHANVSGTLEIIMSRLSLVGVNVAGTDYKLRKRVDAAVNDALEDISSLSPEALDAAVNGDGVTWDKESEDEG